MNLTSCFWWLCFIVELGKRTVWILIKLRTRVNIDLNSHVLFPNTILKLPEQKYPFFKLRVLGSLLTKTLSVPKLIEDHTPNFLKKSSAPYKSPERGEVFFDVPLRVTYFVFTSTKATFHSCVLGWCIRGEVEVSPGPPPTSSRDSNHLVSHFLVGVGWEVGYDFGGKEVEASVWRFSLQGVPSAWAVGNRGSRPFVKEMVLGVRRRTVKVAFQGKDGSPDVPCLNRGERVPNVSYIKGPQRKDPLCP